MTQTVRYGECGPETDGTHVRRARERTRPIARGIHCSARQEESTANPTHGRHTGQNFASPRPVILAQGPGPEDAPSPQQPRARCVRAKPTVCVCGFGGFKTKP